MRPITVAGGTIFAVPLQTQKFLANPVARDVAQFFVILAPRATRVRRAGGIKRVSTVCSGAWLASRTIDGMAFPSLGSPTDRLLTGLAIRLIC